MVLISTLNSIESEYNEIESSKSWKILFMNLKSKSEELNADIEIKAARDSKNKSRNRYRDVLPYDHSRVLLKCIGDSDYINASYVELDSCKEQRRYILTQGPLNNTISHFWRMIWTENSTCIVMLNKIIEKDTVKCAQYFPVSSNEVICHEFQDISLCLSLVETVDKGAYVKRVMSLENKLTNEVRRIIQFHYLAWPDFGVPLTPVSFLEFLWDIRSCNCLSDPSRPPIIHCSAGIGRSGTFVLIDLALLLMTDMGKDEPIINLPSMILELRKCRMGLVQAAEQLRFAYLAIIVGAKSVINSFEIDEINFDSTDNADELELENEASDTDRDSDFSDGSDAMHSNSALDNAAAAVRSRRGLPPTNGGEDTIVIPQSTEQNTKHNSSSVNNSIESSTIVEDRRQIRELRCNRTREKIEEIRNNMRRQDLERNRLVGRLGLKRFLHPLTGTSRNSFIVGITVVVGVVSIVCGLAMYKYVR